MGSKQSWENRIGIGAPILSFCLWGQLVDRLTTKYVGTNIMAVYITRVQTARAMAIQSVIFSLFQTISAIWSYLELIGFLELIGDIKSYLAVSRAIWSHLERFGVIWSHLELFGAIWRYLETLKILLSYFELL